MRIRWLVMTVVLAVMLLLIIGLMPVAQGVQRPEVTSGQVDPSSLTLRLSPPMTTTGFAMYNSFFSAMSQYMTSTNLVNYPNSGPSFGPVGCVPLAGAEFTFTPLQSRPDQPVSFVGNVSSGLEPVYTWDFGMGDPQVGVTTSYVFTDYNDHIVEMTATTDCGQDVARHVVYGPNWQVRSIQPERSVASFPQMIAAAGFYHLLWMEELDGQFDLYYTRRTLTGDWSSPLTVNVAGQTVAPNSRLALAVAADGRAHAVWVDADYRLQYATLPPGGDAWSPVSMNPPISLAWNPALTVDGSGNLYAVWREMGVVGDDIYLAKYAASSQSWSASVKVNEEGFVTDTDSPAVASTTTGRVYVVWTDNRMQTNSDIYYDMLDAGDDAWDPADFEPFNLRVNRQNTADQLDPALVLAGDGTLYAAWMDGRNRASDDENWDIYGARLLSGKLRWQQDSRVVGDTGAAGQALPCLVADGKGQVHLTWMDSRFLELGSSWGVFYSFTNTPGTVWATNQRADVTAEVLPGQWPSLASDPKGNLSVVWRGFPAGDVPRLYEATQPGLPVLYSVTPNTLDNSYGDEAWQQGLTTTEVIRLEGENFVLPVVEANGVRLTVIDSTTRTITATLSQAFSPGVYLVTVLNREIRPSNQLPITITNQADHLGLSPIQNQVAGQPFPLTVQALDKYSLAAIAYAGNPALSDRTGTLDPALAGPFVDGAWSGQVTVTQISAGNVITAADGTLQGHSTPFTVTAPLANLHHFAIAAPAWVTVGVPFSLTVTAEDELSNIIAEYVASNQLIDSSGTVSPTSTGNFAAGIWSGEVTVTRAGTLTLMTEGSGKSGSSGPLLAWAGPLDHLEVSSVSTATAGAAFTLVITAADRFGNPGTFGDTVGISDTTGTVSPTVAGPFVGGTWVGGVRITQAALAVQIYVSGAGLSGHSNLFSVVAGPLDHYSVSTSSYQRTAGTRFYVEVEAQDAYSNVVGAGLSTIAVDNSTAITLSSTLSGLEYAANPLSLVEGWAGTFVTTTVGGIGAISARDGQGHEGSTPPVTIIPSFLDSLILSPTQVTLSPYTAYTFTVEAFDQYGNSISDLDTTWDVVAGGGSVDRNGRFVAGPTAAFYSDTLRVTGLWHGVSQAANAAVTILPGSLAQVDITPESATISLLGQQDFDAQGYDAYGNPISDLGYTWQVITSGGMIDQSGLFQAGTLAGDFPAAILVHSGTFSDTASVSIQPGLPSRATIAASLTELPADGQSYAVLTICLLDAYDNDAADGTPVTVTVDSGSIGWTGATAGGCTNRLLTAATSPGLGHLQVEGLPATGDTTIIYRHLPPSAYFTAWPLTGVEPLTVTFVATTTGVISTYTWLFDDGDMSHLISPTHVYTRPGIYIPYLVLVGPGGTVTNTSFSAIEVVTRVTSVTLSPGYTLATVPGVTLIYTHLLTNTGTIPDAYDITATSAYGWETVVPTAPLTMSPLTTATIQLGLIVPVGVVSGTLDGTVLSATSHAAPNTAAVVTDTTIISQVLGIALSPGYHQTANPGVIVMFTHSVTNTGNYTDTFGLTHLSNHDWLVTHYPTITVGYGQATSVVISLEVPADILSGTVDNIVITATSQAGAGCQVVITDTVVINQITDFVYLPLVLKGD